MDTYKVPPENHGGEIFNCLLNYLSVCACVYWSEREGFMHSLSDLNDLVLCRYFQ